MLPTKWGSSKFVTVSRGGVGMKSLTCHVCLLPRCTVHSQFQATTVALLNREMRIRTLSTAVWGPASTQPLHQAHHGDSWLHSCIGITNTQEKIFQKDPQGVREAASRITHISRENNYNIKHNCVCVYVCATHYIYMSLSHHRKQTRDHML